MIEGFESDRGLWFTSVRHLWPLSLEI